MTHSVHTAHDIMLQDTEGERRGRTQLVLTSMPQTGRQALNLAQEELWFTELFLVAKKHY